MSLPRRNRVADAAVGIDSLTKRFPVLAAAVALGAHVAWDRGLLAVLVLFLIMLAYIPFAILIASLVIAFRTTGSLSRIVVTLSSLLGGVYYPTTVIPSWLHDVSGLVPLTYGLRALRRSVLDRAPLDAIASDLGILSAFAVVLLGSSLVVFAGALRYARRAGTLAQY
jgi:ABC-2 type transport system permease protein